MVESQPERIFKVVQPDVNLNTAEVKVLINQSDSIGDKKTGVSVVTYTIELYVGKEETVCGQVVVS